MESNKCTELSPWWLYRMKAKYHNTPWNQWDSLDELVSDEFKGIYEINKNLEIRNTRTGTVWRSGEYPIDAGGYEIMYFGNGRGVTDYEKVHLLSTGKYLFNPDPKNRTQIDHINRNKLDNSLVNTVFATPEENMRNRTLGISDRYAFEVYSKYDINRENCLTTILYCDFDTEELRKYKDKIVSSMRKRGEFRGLVYIKVDLLLKEYLTWAGPVIEKDYNPLHPELGGWIEHPNYPGVWVNSNGTHKIGKDGEVTVGGFHGKYYLRSNILGEGVLDSNLVFTAFKGPIPEGLEVCHEDGNPKNNNINNLEVRTHSENMKNQFTQERLGKAVVMINPITFEIEAEFISAPEAQAKTGIDATTIGKVCRGKGNIAGNKLWAFKGEEAKRIEEFKSSGFDFQRYLYSQREYSVEEAISISKDFRNRYSLQKGDNKAYVVLKNNNLLDVVFPVEDMSNWNDKEYVKSITSKYPNYTKLCKKSLRAVKAIERNGWNIKDFYPDYKPQNRKK